MKKVISFLFITMFIISGVVSVGATETAKTSLSINTDGQAYHNFSVANAMPGDTNVEEFKILVEHNADSKITCVFENGENSSVELLNALNAKIYIKEIDKTVYDGKFVDLVAHDLYVNYANDKEELNYTIQLFLPTETGNECQNKILSGKFIWSCETVGEVPDDGDVYDPPQTGDNSSPWIYILISVVAICGVVILLIYKKRKGGNDE